MSEDEDFYDENFELEEFLAETLCLIEKKFKENENIDEEIETIKYAQFDDKEYNKLLKAYPKLMEEYEKSSKKLIDCYKFDEGNHLKILDKHISIIIKLWKKSKL